MQTEQARTITSLMAQILRYLLLLGVFIGVGAGAGFGLASLQTPQWKAVSRFEPPHITDLGNYYALLSTYVFINGGEPLSYKLIQHNNGALSLVPEVSQRTESVAIENSYQQFTRNLTSSDLLQQFLLQHELVKKAAQAQNLPTSIVAQQFAGQFHFDRKAQQLSVISVNPEQATTLLIDFIQFANEQAKTTLNADLIAKWRILFEQVKQAAELKLGAVQQGTQIAQQDWQGKLNMMRAVQPLDNRLEAFHFVQKPSIPTQPHSPNVMLWAMMGGVGGLLFGLFFISLLSLSRRRYA